MFYKARSKNTGNMWDVWLYHHEGTYFLYSLCVKAGGIGGWDNISMARSPDGVHWEELGPVLEKGADATWMGTGSTWKNPTRNAKPAFQINYSLWKGPRQTILFAQSDDLVHWTPCAMKTEFVQDERWYEPTGRWDCIWTVPRRGGGLYGYWTASPKAATGGQFGFGESSDGIKWKALKPPKVGGVGVGEVGAVEKIGSRYFMLFGTNGHMEALVADKPQGPFTVLTRNQTFLGGHTYFARFFQSPSGLLVCHHSIARDGQVSMGLLKGTDVDEEGTFRLTWWPGNEALKHKALTVEPLPAVNAGPIAMLKHKLDATAGVVLEGTIELPKPLGAPRGLFVEHGKKCGTAILFNSDGRAEIGAIGAGGKGFKPDRSVDREMQFGTLARFRLVLKGVLMEVYLDDFLIECYSLPAAATGRIGLILGGQSGSIGKLKAWK